MLTDEQMATLKAHVPALSVVKEVAEVPAHAGALLEIKLGETRYIGSFDAYTSTLYLAPAPVVEGA